MKIKYSSIVGILAVLVLIASFVVPGRLTSPEPVAADHELMEWNIVDTPDTQQLLYWRVAPAPERSIELAEQNIGCLKSLIVNLELWKQLNSVQQVSVAAIHLKQQQCTNQ